jgi:hypothetical protein
VTLASADLGGLLGLEGGLALLVAGYDEGKGHSEGQLREEGAHGIS